MIRKFQQNGATLTDLKVIETVEIKGHGTEYITESITNKKGMLWRRINFDYVPLVVTNFMSCLIPGHDEDYCDCFGASGIHARAMSEEERLAGLVKYFEYKT